MIVALNSFSSSVGFLIPLSFLSPYRSFQTLQNCYQNKNAKKQSHKHWSDQIYIFLKPVPELIELLSHSSILPPFVKFKVLAGTKVRSDSPATRLNRLPALPFRPPRTITYTAKVNMRIRHEELAARTGQTLIGFVCHQVRPISPDSMPCQVKNKQ
jgi:hypothetical protein